MSATRTTTAVIDRCDPGHVSGHVVVEAPAAELYALLADPHRHHEVDGSRMVQADVIGPRELLLGDRFSVGMRLGPVPYRMTSTVTRAEPGRALEWALAAGHRWRWEFEDRGDGTTLVTETWQAQGARLGPVPLGRVFQALDMHEKVGRGIRASLDRVAARYA